MKTATFTKLSVLATSIAILSTSAFADYTVDYSTVFTGSSPIGSTPWATLTVKDIAADTVQFYLTNNTDLASNQFITRLLFSTNGPTAGLTGTGLTSNVLSVGLGDDAFFFANRDFDGSVDFSLAQGSRLLGGQTASWNITGSGLTSTYFNFSGVGPATLVKFQGIGPNDESGHTAPVPEPGGLIALAIGSVLLARRRRKKA